MAKSFLLWMNLVFNEKEHSCCQHSAGCAVTQRHRTWYLNWMLLKVAHHLSAPSFFCPNLLIRNHKKKEFPGFYSETRLIIKDLVWDRSKKFDSHIYPVNTKESLKKKQIWNWHCNKTRPLIYKSGTLHLHLTKEGLGTFHQLQSKTYFFQYLVPTSVLQCCCSSGPGWSTLLANNAQELGTLS